LLNRCRKNVCFLSTRCFTSWNCRTRGSSIVERPRDALSLCQLKCHFTVVHITQTDCVSTGGALSATAIFHFGYLHNFVHASFNYRTASEHVMPYVSSTDFHNTNNLVDVNWTVTVTIKLRLPPKLLMTPHIPPPAHRRGRGPRWRMDTNFRR